MKNETSLLLDKAERSIQSAERELAISPEFSIGRAYYAMFYIAEALLFEKELHFRKHGAVHGAYGYHFAKKNLMDPKFHEWLLEAYEKRIASDYGIDPDIELNEALILVQRSKEFLAASRAFLDQQRP